MASEQIPPWTYLPCEECGVTYLATRSEPGTPPFVCEGCEMYARGREDGRREGVRIGLTTAWGEAREEIIDIVLRGHDEGE